jgi:glycosyltransferase involved in cell wall biosynthesis
MQPSDERPVPTNGQEQRRTRFAFFGQLTPYKGVTVLLEAMKILADRDAAAGMPATLLRLHGSNMDFFSDEFQRKTRRLLEATKRHVTLAGRYDASELPRLMADIDWVVVPSIWWENSPLVIQEAFAHGRPVICSDIGGMAEKVADNVNGLHFRVNDPVSLADTIRRAATEPGLWDRLRCGIAKPYAMSEHVAALEQMYGRLLDGARPS